MSDKEREVRATGYSRRFRVDIEEVESLGSWMNRKSFLVIYKHLTFLSFPSILCSIYRLLSSLFH